METRGVDDGASTDAPAPSQSVLRRRFLIRDSVIVATAILAWWLLAPVSAGAGLAADLTGWIVGLLLGVCAYLAHEWSHYLGALAMGSSVTVSDRVDGGFLFRFEAEGNTLAQFVVMSLAGFAATALAIIFFYTALPDAWLASRVARGGALFLALLGVTLEVPLLLYGLVIRRVPEQVSV